MKHISTLINTFAKAVSGATAFGISQGHSSLKPVYKLTLPYNSKYISYSLYKCSFKGKTCYRLRCTVGKRVATACCGSRLNKALAITRTLAKYRVAPEHIKDVIEDINEG